MKWIALFSLVLCACAHDRTLIEKPFFYEISKGSNRGVILGTLRTGISADELPEPVLTAFKSADVYVMENQAGNFDLVDRFSERQATPLTSLLSSQEYAAMKSWLDSSYYADQVNRMLVEDSPVGVAEKLALARMCDRNFNQCRSMRYFQFVPLERQLFQRRDAIDVVYLDTNNSGERARSCLSWTDAETRENILSSLTGRDRLSAVLDRWAALDVAYRSGDAATVAAAASKYKTPEQYNCVIVDRNELFAGAIDDVLKRYRTPFITVSVGHMEGAKSLQERLRNDGYRVERVEFERLRKAH